MTPSIDPRGERTPWGPLALLVLAGLALRVWGLAFGLPWAYHVDEPLYRTSALNFAWERIHPHFGPFQVVVLIFHKLLALLQPLLSGLGLSPEMQATIADRNASFHLVARWVSALFGAVTAIPLYLLGRRLWSAEVGWLAAIFLTFSYIHGRQSHYGVPDTMATFLVVLAALVCTRLSPAGPIRPYLIAAVLAGLAFPTKQLTWPVFLLIYLFHALPETDAEPGESAPPGILRRLWRGLWSGRLWLAALVSVAVALAFSPQVVLHWKMTYAFWSYTASLGAQGGLDRLKLDDGPPWWFHLQTLRWGVGEVLAVLALAGLAFVLWRRRPRQVALVVCFPILFYLFLLRPGNVQMARYGLVGLPFLLLCAAALLAAGLAAAGLRGRVFAAVAGLAAAVALAQPVLALVRHDALLVRDDTRTLAKRWIEENVPEGETVVLESWWFCPQLQSATVPVPLSRRTYRVLLKGPYGLSEKSGTLGPSQGTPRIEDYVSDGVKYVCTNSLTSGSHLFDPAEDRTKRDFYRELARRAERVAAFSPYVPGREVPRVFDVTYGPLTHLSWLERPGPVVEIYRLPDPAPEPDESGPADPAPEP